MKFICYIRIKGDNFSRITFSIVQTSNTEFIATPIQNKIDPNAGKLPVIYLFKDSDNWKYKFENDEIWLTDDKVNSIITSLIEKLEDQKPAYSPNSSKTGAS